MYNVYSQLVYALKGSDVQDVLVNGKLVVRDRKVLTLDAGSVLKEATVWADKIRASVSLPKP
jgi:5-methylthioadenosine/S-adenosylhomocysteine deaminase